MKKILAFVLLAAMLFSLGACSKPEDPNGPSPDGPTADVFLDSVPTKDYGGDSVVFSLFEGHQNEIYKEELKPDACDEAIKNRNAKIENRFNIKIEQECVVGQTTQDHCSSVRSALLNQSAEFDITLTMLWLSGPLVTSMGYFDLRYDVTYVKDSIGVNPWWGEGVNNAFTICDRQYVGSTDINLSAITTTWCILFNKGMEENKRIAAGLGEVSMYDVVRHNKWTLDTLYNLAKDVWEDNATGTTPGEVGQDDTFGVLSNGTWWAEIAAASAGIRMVINDGQNAPELTPFTSFTQIAERISNINNAKGFIGPQKKPLGEGLNPTKKFSAGEALFYLTTFGTLDNDEIHDSDVEFGIIPMPKGSTSQQKYYAASQDAASVIGVPITAMRDGEEHFEAVCATLEALAAESHNTVLPAYYDVILKHKNTRDEESLEMIDIIYAGRIYDFASVHSSSQEELRCDMGTGNSSVGLAYVMREFATNPTLCASAWSAAGDLLAGRLEDLVDEYMSIYERAE